MAQNIYHTPELFERYDQPLDNKSPIAAFFRQKGISGVRESATGTTRLRQRECLSMGTER